MSQGIPGLSSVLQYKSINEEYMKFMGKEYYRNGPFSTTLASICNYPMLIVSNTTLRSNLNPLPPGTRWSLYKVYGDFRIS